MTLLRIAMAAVRAWTCVYTFGLDRNTRRERRAEIDSDLWHAEHDDEQRADPRLWLHICARLVAGIPDDVSWRVERVTLERRPAFALLTALGAVTTAAVIWIGLAAQAPALPPLPDAPSFFKFAGVSVEPIPPPPPPAPPPPGRPSP